MLQRVYTEILWKEKNSAFIEKKLRLKVDLSGKEGGIFYFEGD
jgi:hypothetical protein